MKTTDTASYFIDKYSKTSFHCNTEKLEQLAYLTEFYNLFLYDKSFFNQFRLMKMSKIDVIIPTIHMIYSDFRANSVFVDRQINENDFISSNKKLEKAPRFNENTFTEDEIKLLKYIFIIYGGRSYISVRSIFNRAEFAKELRKDIKVGDEKNITTDEILSSLKKLKREIQNREEFTSLFYKNVDEEKAKELVLKDW